VLTNGVILKEGSESEHLYLILNGLVGVQISSVSDVQLATLGPGELLGEISFLDERPATATVTAVENTLLLSVPKKALGDRLEEDPAFAARLYKSFARVISRRFRERVGALGRMLHARLDVQKAVGDKWKRISVALDEFKLILQKADQEALKNDNVVPEELAGKIHAEFMALLPFLNGLIGDDSGESEDAREELGRRVQRELLPYLLLTRTAERLYAKPRGYCGDYLTIDWLYRNEPGGSGRIGPLLDRVILDAPAAHAVKNRRGLLAEEILRVVEQKNDGPARVTSLASGPAREIFDVFDQLEVPSRLEVNLLDIDLQALAFVSDELARRKLKHQVELTHANLVYLATGRQAIDIKEQDLVYSIGLIDYFHDRFVILLLDYVYELLRPGGKVILGNFHTSNVCKAFIEFVLDWRMIHRTEADMNRLYSASRFGRPSTGIRFEQAGVNLFAECIKG
jgi:hypothetical protein